MTDFKMVLAEAEKGREIINACIADNGENQAIVVFPDNDRELLEVAYRYFDRFLSDYDYVAVLASINVKKLTQYTNRPFNIIQISEKDMQGVLRYVSMIDLTSIKIISLKMSHCQRAEILKDFKDITLDKIVYRALYGIWGHYSYE